VERSKPISSQKHLEQYVVGIRENGHIWLLPEISGDSADDRNLDGAKRFTSLSEAITVSTKLLGTVFEIVVADKGQEALSELRVHLQEAQGLPYHGCYWPVDDLLIGPNPICPDSNQTQNRFKALRRVGVRCVISLLSREELFCSREEENEEWLDSFDHHVFPILNGGTPTKPMMALILDLMEQRILRNELILVHCWGGRGRAGLVAACFVARRGIATGQRALNLIARKRFEVGLFTPTPETQIQEEFARSWKEGS
jgi:protein-tyrosine phosphatase